jgi:hypothetical protein
MGATGQPGRPSPSSLQPKASGPPGRTQPRPRALAPHATGHLRLGQWAAYPRVSDSRGGGGCVWPRSPDGGSGLVPWPRAGTAADAGHGGGAGGGGGGSGSPWQRWHQRRVAPWPVVPRHAVCETCWKHRARQFLGPPAGGHTPVGGLYWFDGGSGLVPWPRAGTRADAGHGGGAWGGRRGGGGGGAAASPGSVGYSGGWPHGRSFPATLSVEEALHQRARRGVSQALRVLESVKPHASSSIPRPNMPSYSGPNSIHKPAL